MLLIAAIVSIALGIYEDYGMKHEPTLRFTKDYEPYYATDPKISWVEGVAILVAVIIVVMVGSINDYQKEAQFRKLNAKKEDREVKVCGFLYHSRCLNVSYGSMVSHSSLTARCGIRNNNCCPLTPLLISIKKT